MSISLRTSFILLGILIYPKITMGCFCDTPKDSFEIAEVVFRGIAHTQNDFYEGADCYYCLSGLVKFKVDTVLKGDAYIKTCKEFVILQEAGSCSFYFEHDSAYLVYAKYVYQFEHNKKSALPFLSTHQCTGTNILPANSLKTLPDVSEEEPSSSDKIIQSDPNRLWNGWLLFSILLNLSLLIFLANRKVKASKKNKSI
ncbi:MAG: hypothetical protein AAF696_25865 [Bacteroidota bacterium]